MNILRLFLISLSFLTCIPVRLKNKIKNEEFAKSIAFFPVIGLILGLLLILSEYLLTFILPGSIVKLLLVVILITLTSGLHIDGLADTVDALVSRKNKEDALRIMKESTIGPMGAMAIFGCLALKYLALQEFFYPTIYKLLLFFPLIGRMAMVTACWQFPYARNEGTGKVFIGKGGVKEFVIAGTVSLIVSFLLFSFKGLFILIITIISTIFLGNFLVKKFGGITGDNLGFLNELGELIALIGATVIF